MKTNSTLRTDGQQTIVNSYEPGVNDELATVNDSQSTAGSPQSAGVNDDMAAYTGGSETTVVTFTKVPYNNGSDPGRASGSFVFLVRRSSAAVAKLWQPQSEGGLLTDLKVSLCQIFLQPIFNAVELFKKDTPALIPVRVKNENGSVSRENKIKIKRAQM